MWLERLPAASKACLVHMFSVFLSLSLSLIFHMPLTLPLLPHYPCTPASSQFPDAGVPIPRHQRLGTDPTLLVLDHNMQQNGGTEAPSRDRTSMESDTSRALGCVIANFALQLPHPQADASALVSPIPPTALPFVAHGHLYSPAQAHARAQFAVPATWAPIHGITRVPPTTAHARPTTSPLLRRPCSHLPTHAPSLCSITLSRRA